MPELLLAALMYTGTFSGVGLDNLMARPLIVTEMLLQADGRQMAPYATGLTFEERDGKTVGIAGEGFSLKLTADFAVGDYALSVLAAAPSRGADSFWVAVDGERLEGPLTLPVGPPDRRSHLITIKQAGRHVVELSLREGAGAVLTDFQLGRPQIRPPLPPMRPELVGKHPRLLLTATDLPRLRARVKDPRVKRYYQLPEVLTRKPAAYKPKARNGGGYRPLGNYALGYRLEPDPAQLDGVIAWLEEATRYGSVGVDLDAEYFLEGVALSYDWLHDDLPADLRDRVRQTIADKCREIYAASLSGRQGGGYAYQQNHYWYAHLALALGAAAVYGEVPEATDWLAWAWDRFERIVATFGPDGGFHEGPGYWDFSMPTLYLYLDLYEWCTGLKVTAADPGLKGQFEFRFRHLYPGLKLSACLEDSSPTIGTPWTALGLWQAKRFRDPMTMGLVQKLGKEPLSAKQNLLWLDETVKAQDALAKLPLARHYADVEDVFARTSWGPEATALAFVSRPMGGHVYADLCARYDLSGTGHNHPEQNHFVLFGRGEVLAADPGYTYDKQTRNHNTVLVGGKGQYGDGQMWPAPNPGRAHITGLVNQGDVTIASGDATSAYPPEVGLTRFERTIVLAGRDLVVVCDHLAAKEPQAFSWLLHHFGQAAQAGKGWTVTRNAARLTVLPLAPDTLNGTMTTYRPQYVHPTRNLTPDEADIGLLELRTEPLRETTFLVPLVIADKGAAPPAVRDLSDNTRAAVRLGNTVVAFNRGSGLMAVPTPWGQEIRSKARAVVARLQGAKHQVVSLEGK